MTNEELIPIAKIGDKKALMELYDNNKGIMHKLIFKYSISNTDREDFLQECYFVLLNCVNKYDPNKGVLFITYLTAAIICMILKIKKKEKKHEDEISLNSDANSYTEDLEIIDIIKDPKAEEFIDSLEWSYFQSQVQRAISVIEQPAKNLTFENLGKQLTIKYLSQKYKLPERDTFNYVRRTKEKLRKNKDLRMLAIDYGIISPDKYKPRSIEEIIETRMAKLRTLGIRVS